MTENRQTALFILCGAAALCSFFAVLLAIQINDHTRFNTQALAALHADNQSLAAMRAVYLTMQADKAKLEADLQDTEEALDKTAFEAMALKEALDHPADVFNFRGILESFQIHHLFIAMNREGPLTVQNVGDSAGHPRGKISSRLS